MATVFDRSETLLILWLSFSLLKAIIAKIWRLADIDGNWHLSPEEFTVALHLVSMYQSGQPLPSHLPFALVPPSMRAEAVRRR